MGQFDDYPDTKFPRLPNPGYYRDTPAWAVELHQKLESHITRTIMAAIDDLKTAVAGLISEATTDITALINQINASNSAGAQDPAIEALATSMTTQIAALHTAFTNATAVPVPSAPPAAVAAANTTAATVASTGQPVTGS